MLALFLLLLLSLGSVWIFKKTGNPRMRMRAENPRDPAEKKKWHPPAWLGKMAMWIGFCIVFFGCIAWLMMLSHKHSKDTPVVLQKVVGPTEVLYRLEVCDSTGRIVQELSGNFFRLRIKGDSFFEGYHPTRNAMDGPNRLSFSERLGSGEKGVWKDEDPTSKLGNGYFQVWAGEYHPALKETIHAWFWPDKMDPAKESRWTMKLVPTDVLVTNWTHQ